MQGHNVILILFGQQITRNGQWGTWHFRKTYIIIISVKYRIGQLGKTNNKYITINLGSSNANITYSKRAISIWIMETANRESVGML